jgi:hypothetical protein
LRSRSSSSRSSRKHEDSHFNDDMYENFAIDNDAVPIDSSSSSEESVAKGSRKLIKGKFKERKPNKWRLEFLKRKRDAEEGRARKNRQLQIVDKVDYEAYLKKNPPDKLTLTQWSIENGKFRPPKFDKKPRFHDEKNRSQCALDVKGCMVGTGSFYQRPYGAYTFEELHAPQSRTMRVRTKDLLPPDQINRELQGDDSDEESDWLNRTGHPVFHVKPLEARKATNRSLFVVTKDYQNTKLPSAVAKEVSRRSKVQKRAAEELEKKPAAKSK